MYGLAPCAWDLDYGCLSQLDDRSNSFVQYATDEVLSPAERMGSGYGLAHSRIRTPP
jgi:hypothetical protein